jgi:hypothetical protein
MKSSANCSSSVAHSFSLRRRGYAWVAIARAVEQPLPEVRALAHLYAQRAAAEFVREAPTEATP